MLQAEDSNLLKARGLNPLQTRGSNMPSIEASDLPRLTIINIPDLNWDDLTAQGTPTLYQFAKNSAIANMNAPWSDLAERVAAEEGIALYCLDTGKTLEQYDRQVADLLEQFQQPHNQQVIAVLSASIFSSSAAESELTPFIIFGAELSGYALSESTNRVGLVVGDDLISLGRHLAAQGGVQEADSSARPSLISHPTSETLENRIAQLEHNRNIIEAMRATKPFVCLLYLSLVFIAFGFSVVLLLARRIEKNGSRNTMVLLVRILWLVVLSFPPATFLMFLFVPHQPDGAQLMFICALWVVCIALVALCIGYRTQWIHSLFFLLLSTITVIVIGQLFGGPLNEPGYLTYDVTQGSRYYGMGNEQGALFFGAWFVFSGLLINRFPEAAGVKAFKRWGFVLGSAVLLFITACSWFGSSFGPLVWVSFGVVIMWRLFCGHRIRWWFFLFALLLSGILAIGILCIDIQFNSFSHMGEYRSLLNESFFTMIFVLLQTAWEGSALLIVKYIPVPAILLFLIIVVFLIILRLFKPGIYRDFWNRNQAYSAVYVVSFLIALIMLCLEDSAFFTPAVFLIYSTSGFIWLVCDMHGMHLPELAKVKNLSVERAVT